KGVASERRFCRTFRNPFRVGIIYGLSPRGAADGNPGKLDATPSGLGIFGVFTQGSRGRQPWAMGRNPLGVETQHSSLSTQHSSLSTPHSSLSTQHSSLSTPHSSLSTQHSALSAPHSSLSTRPSTSTLGNLARKAYCASYTLIQEITMYRLKVRVLAIVVTVALYGGWSSLASQTSHKSKIQKHADVDGTRIIKADQEPGKWMSHGRTYNEQRFSPLKDINAGNAPQLALAWHFDLDTDRGQEATPVVVDGVMYFTSAWSKVFALNAATGQLLWSYDPKVPREWGVNAC